MNLQTARVALAHDWLLNRRGAERLLKEFCLGVSNPSIFTLFCNRQAVDPVISRQPIFTSYLDYLPGVFHYYRYLLPWFQAAARSVNVTDQDLLISVSHAVSKNFSHDSSIPHICYCLTPMRYAWCQELYEPALAGSWKGISLRLLTQKLKQQDLEANRGIDFFVAISRNVQNRIQRFYGRESDLIYPCIDHQFFRPDLAPREDFFLMVSALVPQKRPELAVDAFNENGKQLLVIGNGPEKLKLSRSARANIKFLGWISDQELRSLYRRAHALIIPGPEEFGLVSIEAQACGCPVVACRQGGVIETIVEGESGILFEPSDPVSLSRAVHEMKRINLDQKRVASCTQFFSRDRFWSDWNRLLNNHLGHRTLIETTKALKCR